MHWQLPVADCMHIFGLCQKQAKLFVSGNKHFVWHRLRVQIPYVCQAMWSNWCVCVPETYYATCAVLGSVTAAGCGGWPQPATRCPPRLPITPPSQQDRRKKGWKSDGPGERTGRAFTNGQKMLNFKKLIKFIANSQTRLVRNKTKYKMPPPHPSLPPRPSFTHDSPTCGPKKCRGLGMG